MDADGGTLDILNPPRRQSEPNVPRRAASAGFRAEPEPEQRGKHTRRNRKRRRRRVKKNTIKKTK